MKGKKRYRKSVNSHKQISQDTQNQENEKRLLLYRYMPYEAFEKTIENWSLKLTIPYETNDPFEFMPRCKNLKDVCKLTQKENILDGAYAQTDKAINLQHCLNETHSEAKSKIR